jgi:hypothetical protein
VAKKSRTRNDTTVPPIKADFEKALRALLDTPAPPKNLGRPKPKKKAQKGARKAQE